MSTFLVRHCTKRSAMAALESSLMGYSRVQNCSTSSKLFARWNTTPAWNTRRLFATNGKPGSSAKQSGTKVEDAVASPFASILKGFLEAKKMPERWTFSWYREMVLICTVFAITGTSTMVLVRPAVSKGLGLQGSLKDGPWSYRICSIVVMTPIYATLLVVVGTVFGRHHYFRHFSVKMWSRFGIPPEMIDKSFHETKKNFRKW